VILLQKLFVMRAVAGPPTAIKFADFPASSFADARHVSEYLRRLPIPISSAIVPPPFEFRRVT
jgi:hypothetical protein